LSHDGFSSSIRDFSIINARDRFAFGLTQGVDPLMQFGKPDTVPAK
jgi:hypothetical protein